MTISFEATNVTPKRATRVVSTATAIGAIGVGLLTTAGLPAIALGAVAGAIAMSSGEQKRQAMRWRNDISLQKKYIGRNTANYLISTLETIDFIIEHSMYKSCKWYVGTSYTGVHVMVSSKGDFKLFKTKDEMLQMAHFFVNDLPFKESKQEDLDKAREKAGQVAPSVVDFIADGQFDAVAKLPLGRLIRVDQMHLNLEDYKVKNQSWRLYAMENGMFVAVRGSTNLPYRCFRNRESFWRFYHKSIAKDKRYFLPSEELGENLEAITTIDEENDLIACFLNDIIYVRND